MNDNNCLRSILIIVLGTVILTGCSSGDDPDGSRVEAFTDKPLALVIKQRSDSASAAISNQLLQIFEYTKLPVRTYDTELLSHSFEIPSSVRLLCLTVTDTEQFSDAQVEKIVQFVAAGNMLLITNPVFDDRFNFLTGIRRGVPFQRAAGGTGFRFYNMIFPGFTDNSFQFRIPSIHGGLAADVFEESTEVLAHSYDSLRVPVITRNRVGEGTTVMFNSNMGHEKMMRGVFYALMLPALEGVPYPVANVSTIFLDDFPLPLYDVKTAPVDRAYNLTEGQYIANVWWPDMQALADTFNIDYTAMLAFNYNANVVPPFDFDEWLASDVPVTGVESRGSIGLAQAVRKSRHELGFHGYNHFSLLSSEWPAPEFIAAALQAARRRWKIDNLGPLPVTYVPPTNEIDSAGVAILSRTMPNIRYLSSLYLGERATGGGREFSPEPYAPDIYNYPRITSGFILDNENMLALHGLYLLTGIWTHFVHPDDVFQVKQRTEDTFASRNVRGLGWHGSPEYDYGLYEVFKAHLSRMERIYPLIRYRTVEDAVPEVREWNAMQLKRGVADSLFYTARRGTDREPITWFMYVDSSHTDTLRPYLRKYASEHHMTPVRNGFLVQFTSRSDSLLFPVFRRLPDAPAESPEAVRKAYLSYVRGEGHGEANQDGGGVAGEAPWRDTRLEEARRALQQQPSSRPIQERVIDLAVEMGRVPLAIDILERRLLHNPDWKPTDIERLLTYYGWEGASNRAYRFLETLWRKYGNEPVISLKERMVQRYGRPGESFYVTWLKRELALNPGREETLRELARAYATPEGWPQAKQYLQKLIAQNPVSDTLYHYTLQRSFYYDEPQQTLELLREFPVHARPQLRPLAPQIANLYAYSAGNYSRALRWASRAGDFPIWTQLEWLLQDKRYKAFMQRADRALKAAPANDSLRAFVGRQLIYGGYYDEGYERLYSLFKQDAAAPQTQDLVAAEIGYQPYARKKSFYRKYPAFFPDSLETSLQTQYRRQEGVKGGVRGTYASDNFNNTVAMAGAFVEWGNRQGSVHRIDTEETIVASVDPESENDSRLYGFGYRYRHRWPERGLEFTAGLGADYLNGRIFPDALLGIGYGRDSTYTSARLTYAPELTDNAIRNDITKWNLAIYREDYWFDGQLQTALSGSGKRYSNALYTGEVLGRLYTLLPFSTSHSKLQALGELSYSDASRVFPNADPFFTPDGLFIQGSGVQYRYRDVRTDPGFSLDLELVGKHDNQNGFYLTAAARLNTRLWQYWNLSFDASLSSSAVYRYNRLGLTISYLFPRKL